MERQSSPLLLSPAAYRQLLVVGALTGLNLRKPTRTEYSRIGLL